MRYLLALAYLLSFYTISLTQSPLIQLHESEPSSLMFGESHDGYISVFDNKHGMVIDQYGDRVRSVDISNTRRLNTRFFLIYDSLTFTSSRRPGNPYYLSSSRGELLSEITDRTGDESFAHGDQSEAYIASDAGVIQINIATQAKKLYDTPVKNVNGFAIADDAILWTGDGMAVTDRSLEVLDTLPGDAAYSLPLVGDRFIYAVRTSGGIQEIVAYNYRLQVASRVTVTLDTIIDMVYAKDGVHLLGRKNGSTTLASYRELLTTTDLSVWIDRAYADMIVINNQVLGLFTQDDHAYVDLDIFKSTSDTLHRTVNPSSYIHVNDISTRMDPFGFMIGGPDISYSNTEDQISTIFTGNIWHHAVAADGSEAGTYTQYPNGTEEYSIYGMTDEAWKKTWRTSRKHIENHQEDFADGSIDEVIPHAILTWPSIGNPHLRGEFNARLDLSRKLAPFADVNDDGIYNALDGDYPIIKGDEYVIRFHDEISADNDAISFVVMESMYAYHRDDRDIDNSSFVETQTIYTGSKSLSEYYQAIWIDFDLGCYLDDQIATLEDMDAIYAYNRNAEDANCPPPLASFGSEIPVQSVSLLDQELYSTAVSRAVSPANPVCDNPLDVPEAALIKGLHVNGSPQYIGTDSCDVLGDSITRFAYPGDPSDADAWSMCSPAAQAIADLRAICSSRSTTLSANDFTTSTYLLYTSPPVPHPCPSADEWKDGLQKVRCHYKQGWLESQRSDHDTVTVFSSTISTELTAPLGDLYTWDTDEDTRTIIVLEPGIYTVEVISDLGCRIKQSYIVIKTTSTADLSERQYQVYPSPSTGAFHIVSNDSEPMYLEIYDLSGRSVHKEAINGSVHRDFSSWSSGIYVIRLVDKSGSTFVQKWVKQ